MADPIDRLLVNALHRPTAPADPCPGADALGAYALGELDADERRVIESHVADCRRCAAHVAQLVALEDAEPASGTSAVRGWPWLRWTWAVPAAVAVVVAVVWVAQPPGPSTPLFEVRTPAPAATPRPAPSPAVPPAEAAPAEADRLRADAAHTSRPEVTRKVPPAAPAPSEVTAPVESSLRQENLQREKEAPPPVSSAPAPHAAPAPPPSAAAADSVEERTARANTSDAPATAPASKSRLSAAAREAAGAERSISGFAAGAVAAPPIEIPSPVPAVRWRVVSSAVERTTDGGATWRDDEAPATANLRYGVAVSEDVCWIATPAGTVLRRAADGRWTATDIPGHPAVRALAATSALEAEVTLTDGRSLRTTDGGVTWREMPAP